MDGGRDDKVAEHLFLVLALRSELTQIPLLLAKCTARHASKSHSTLDDDSGSGCVTQDEYIRVTGAGERRLPAPNKEFPLGLLVTSRISIHNNNEPREQDARESPGAGSGHCDRRVSQVEGGAHWILF